MSQPGAKERHTGSDGLAEAGKDNIHGHELIAIREGLEAFLELIQATSEEDKAKAKNHLDLAANLVLQHKEEPVDDEEFGGPTKEEETTRKKLLDRLPSGGKVLASLGFVSAIAITGLVIYLGVKGTEPQEETGDRVNPPTIGTGVESFNQLIEQYRNEIVEDGANQQQIVKKAFSEIDWEKVNANLDREGVPPPPKTLSSELNLQEAKSYLDGLVDGEINGELILPIEEAGDCVDCKVQEILHLSPQDSWDNTVAGGGAGRDLVYPGDQVPLTVSNQFAQEFIEDAAPLDQTPAVVSAAPGGVGGASQMPKTGGPPPESYQAPDSDVQGPFLDSVEISAQTQNVDGDGDFQEETLHVSMAGAEDHEVVHDQNEDQDIGREEYEEVAAVQKDKEVSPTLVPTGIAASPPVAASPSVRGATPNLDEGLNYKDILSKQNAGGLEVYPEEDFRGLTFDPEYSPEKPSAPTQPLVVTDISKKLPLTGDNLQTQAGNSTAPWMIVAGVGAIALGGYTTLRSVLGRGFIPATGLLQDDEEEGNGFWDWLNRIERKKDKQKEKEKGGDSR